MSVNLSFVPFRIIAADEASAGAAFLAGFNAFLTANGYPALVAVGDPIILDVTRIDLDGPFLLPNGFWHVNAMASPMPNAAPAAAQAIMDRLAAQIPAWFGEAQDGTSYPVCPSLATYTNPANPTLGIAGGQQWPQDSSGVVFIDPPPATRLRC